MQFRYRSRRPAVQRGFTLVELMVVVLIISVLATLSVPAIQRTKMKAKTAAIVSDFRTFATAFDTYAQETGKWPAEAGVGVIPPLMVGRLNTTAWKRQTPMGGRYNWEYNRLHFGVRYKAAISISATAASPLPLDVTQMTDIDERIDDGDLMSGSFRYGTGFVPLFVIQP
ncbi:MAG: prepilin-type N-terminal cleavage/methylation domain-containing protein [Phycisphaerales bacterium]|nr:prepilin-type N-terminal cleavage/methylation domain-containing protein [Phycisphaerales bacterium]